MPGKFVGVGELIEVRVHVNFGPYDDSAYNVRHYMCTASAGLGQSLLNVATDFHTELSVLYPPLMTAQGRYQGIGVRRVGPDPTIEILSAKEDAVGTAGVQAMPGQCAGIITFRSLIPGPKGRGRIYVPYPDEADNESGFPTQDYRDRLFNLGTEWMQERVIGVVDQVTLDPVIYHRPPSILAPTGIEDFSVRGRWGTQRSRGGFGAHNFGPFG